MAVPSPGYSITLRVATAVGQASTSDLVAAAAATGAAITALDVVESTPDTVVIDVSADTRAVAHAEEVSGEDLDYFFAQWIDTPEKPRS